MPIYIVSHSDYDTYDPRYVFHYKTYSKDEFRALVDEVIPKAALSLLEDRKLEVANGAPAWYISWDCVVGKTVEFLVDEHGFETARPVEVNYFGNRIVDEATRKPRGIEDEPALIPLEVMEYNREINKKRYPELD